MDFGDGDAGGMMQARAAGRAGIDEQHTVLDHAFGVVRVAKDDHIGFVVVEDHLAGAVREAVRPAGMNDEKGLSTERAALHVAAAAMAQILVGVAEHGRDGRDGAQLIEQRFAADVTGVQDVLDAGKQIGDARIEMTVRIADEADFHCRYDIAFP